MNDIDSIVPKKRCSKKKAATIELPQNVVSQYSRLDNFLSHSVKWTSYEWEYDEIEMEFFNNHKTFESMVSLKFPHLKTRNLTTVEWRKIRKSITGRNVRRFSPKFIDDQRTDLKTYRRRYRLLKENKRLDQLVRLNSVTDDISTLKIDQSQDEMLRIMIKLKKLFQLKSATVAELSEINIVRAEAQNSNIDHTNVNGSAVDAITKLHECNAGILILLDKLLSFHMVKDALLFNALSRKKMTLALSPPYFRNKCDVSIYESHQECRSSTFIESDGWKTLIDSLLAQILTVCDHEQLAENLEDFAKKLIEEHRIILKQTLNEENFNFFESVCVPKLFNIVRIINDDA